MTEDEQSIDNLSKNLIVWGLVCATLALVGIGLLWVGAVP